MFALRGIAVSLTFFVLIYGLLSAIVAGGWRFLQWLRTAERDRANLLFALRILPFVAATAITWAFVVPSFQLLEPRSNSNGEGLGTIPLTLGLCALLLIGYGCFRVTAALVRTRRAVARWLQGTRPLSENAPTIALFAGRTVPPLTLVGLRRPKVLISEAAVALLSADELRIALKHERAHVQSCDNLKKLIFRFCPFPGMANLETTWAQTVELAADDAAVSRVEDALDLAAALVKLSRLAPVAPAPVCTVGFVTGSISARVERLLAWKNTGTFDATDGDRDGCKVQLQICTRYVMLPVLLTLFFVVSAYGPALALTHEVTEWLVR